LKTNKLQNQLSAAPIKLCAPETISFSAQLAKKIPYTIGVRDFLLYELRLLFRIERELSDDDFLTEIDIL
jgi:hypothetical protein